MQTYVHGHEWFYNCCNIIYNFPFLSGTLFDHLKLEKLKAHDKSEQEKSNTLFQLQQKSKHEHESSCISAKQRKYKKHNTYTQHMNNDFDKKNE